VVDPDDTESGRDSSSFPLSLDDLSKVTLVIRLIRSRLSGMKPAHVRCASALLRALERLPANTPGVHMTFGFVQPSNGGNYGWADISFNSSELRFGTGEHFYEPGVGGDTESRVVFEAFGGGAWAEGDIEDWIAAAHALGSSQVSVEDDTDYDAIDWNSDTERDELGDLEPPPKSSGSE
jgi:hypothetical protein